MSSAANADRPDLGSMPRTWRTAEKREILNKPGECEDDWVLVVIWCTALVSRMLCTIR